MSTNESVWDYPRPPAIEPVEKRIRVVFGGRTIVDTAGAFRVLETSHPPVYYIPPGDVAAGVLTPVERVTFCEFKGVAGYCDVVVGTRRARAAAWLYPEPTAGYEQIAGYLAFYPNEMDECWVGDEMANPQAGSFYGGWITRGIQGPFKRG